MTAYAIERGTLALEPVDAPRVLRTVAAPVVEVAPVARPAGRTGRLIGLTAADLDLIGTAPATAAFFAA